VPSARPTDSRDILQNFVIGSRFSRVLSRRLV
jgi:hypothetical protein